jgi:hypothetical protein
MGCIVKASKVDKITKYSVAALSIIDQLESAMIAGEEQAKVKAIELVKSTMEEPNGVMFMVQGIKLMLMALQQETAPDSFDKKFEIQHVWALLNQHATDGHRNAFNEFRSELYSDADKLQDWVRRLALLSGNNIPEAMEGLMNRVCSVPALEK